MSSTDSSVAAAVPSDVQPLPQRRPSSMRQVPPAKRSVGDFSAGPDVTPTSPATSPSFASIRPLPPPSLYQPPPSMMTSTSESEPPCSFSSGSSAAGSDTMDTSCDASESSGVKLKENTGRWLAEEHEVFLKGLNEHGKQWKKIATMIKTRSVVQVRTHAQKYFQKLHKNEKKAEGHPGKASSISTSTATSTSSTAAIKRKSSTGKGPKTTAASAVMTKKRRVSLEPKPKKQQQATSRMFSAPPLPAAPSAAVAAATNAADHTVIDPSFMNSLNMAEGELADSLLDLLDDSSVEAVEHVMAADDMDMDFEPNALEPNPVSPSVSSVSLVDSHHEPQANETNRHDLVSSPNPEDFSIHNTIGTSSLSDSPTGVACVMDIKDFEQKTSGYVDALDWLMDVGVHQLPATDGEEEWNSASATTAKVVSLPSRPAPQMSVNKLAQVNSSALSIMDGDTF